jgi:hypothetical protein
MHYEITRYPHSLFIYLIFTYPLFTQTLTTLDLSENQVGDELQGHVEKLIKRNERMIKS